MRKIKLTKGKFALVDNKDHEMLIKYHWHYRPDGYAARRNKTKNGKQVALMHRFILDLKPKEFCDHKNGNRIDNRRKNLRRCSSSENNMNANISKRNTTGYKGVSWYKRLKKWRVQIASGGKYFWLGYHSDIRKAAQVYNKKATKLHGKFSKINKIKK